MNKVILMGRLARDPEVRHTPEPNSTAVARYTLAVDRRTRSENGETQADFIGCVAFGKSAEFAEKYLKKGTKVAIVGHIQTGSYTNKDGQKVYTTDVVVEDQEFAESKRPETQPAYAQGATQQPYAAPAQAPQYAPAQAPQYGAPVQQSYTGTQAPQYGTPAPQYTAPVQTPQYTGSPAQQVYAAPTQAPQYTAPAPADGGYVDASRPVIPGGVAGIPVPDAMGMEEELPFR